MFCNISTKLPAFPISSNFNSTGVFATGDQTFIFIPSETLKSSLSVKSICTLSNGELLNRRTSATLHEVFTDPEESGLSIIVGKVLSPKIDGESV